jgi:hypothetical protein
LNRIEGIEGLDVLRKAIDAGVPVTPTDLLRMIVDVSAVVNQLVNVHNEKVDYLDSFVKREEEETDGDNTDHGDSAPVGCGLLDAGYSPD